MSKYIQFISNNFFEDANSIKSSYFNNYESFNTLKFNVIDLNDNIFWNYEMFSDNKELSTITNAINNSDNKTLFIFLLPQNISVTTKESRIITESLRGKLITQ